MSDYSKILNILQTSISSAIGWFSSFLSNSLVYSLFGLFIASFAAFTLSRLWLRNLFGSGVHRSDLRRIARSQRSENNSSGD